MYSHVVRRRISRRRVLLTVSKTLALTLFGAALIAIPWAIATVGSLAGIR
jgi:hypothetical protein